jgi:hypothetical protein
MKGIAAEGGGSGGGGRGGGSGARYWFGLFFSAPSSFHLYCTLPLDRWIYFSLKNRFFCSIFICPLALRGFFRLFRLIPYLHKVSLKSAHNRHGVQERLHGEPDGSPEGDLAKLTLQVLKVIPVKNGAKN